MSCLSSSFFFIKTYLWDSFFLGKTNIGTCFFLPKKQCFFSCLLALGKVLPSHWQGFATALAKLCHRHGKSLPRRKQGVGKITSWLTSTYLIDSQTLSETRKNSQLQTPLYIPQKFSFLLLLFNKKVKLNSWQKRGKQLTLHPTNKSGLRFF